MLLLYECSSIFPLNYCTAVTTASSTYFDTQFTRKFEGEICENFYLINFCKIMYPSTKLNNKVPGSLFISAKTDREKKEIVKDLTKLSKVELEEILVRQKNLLANK